MTPRIIALLAWYDENPGWLYNAITSLHHANVDHLIACDGAYALYPDGKPRSPIEQHEAIHRAAEHLAIGATIHVPATTWRDNEIEKRSKLFQLGDTIANPNQDWFMVWDADQILTDCPADLKTRLASTDRDVGEVTFAEPHPELKRRDFPIPILFRAIPGIRVIDNHFSYVTPDGRHLWGNAVTHHLEPRLDLNTIRVEHLTHYRTTARRRAADGYYDHRDETTAEQFQCGHPACTQTAKTPLPVHWHPNDGGYVAEWVWACRDHRELLANRGRYELAQHAGWERATAYYRRKLWLTSSNDLAVEHRAGPAPIGAAP